jgi:hypothetical protein
MAGAGLTCTSLAATQGIAGVLSGGTRTQAAGEYLGPLFVSFSADGGWDITMHCDPKANLSNAYGNGGIATAGAIKYANVGNNAAFFDKYADRLLVCNGIDVASNNHAIARRHTWTGKLDDTHPHIAAMVAGSHAPQLPLSFIAEGLTDETRGIVARTRIDNADVLNDLASPNMVAPEDPDDMRMYHPESANEMIAQWREDRATTKQAAQNLPHIEAALDNLVTVRSGANELALLESYLPDPLSNNATRRKIQIAVAAYKAGLAVSATFSRRGFDTHDNNDDEQVTQLDALFGNVDFLWEEAARQGIEQDLVVAIGSDFGRTPSYNSRNGRNHWETTSMMLMGQGIEGNRVVGETDSGLNAMKIDPVSLAPSSDGVMLQPKHIHRALRDLLGVTDNLDGRFALQTDELPLLG